MFQLFGFVVEFFDWVAENFMQKSFDEAVMADDLDGALAACGGEADAFVALVVDLWALFGGQLLQHVGDRGGSDVEVRCYLSAADAAFSVCAEGEDRLQVVVDGFGAAFACHVVILVLSCWFLVVSV